MFGYLVPSGRIKGLGGASYLKVVCHYRWALRFLKSIPLPVSLLLGDQDVNSQLLLQCYACLSACYHRVLTHPIMMATDFNSLIL